MGDVIQLGQKAAGSLPMSKISDEATVLLVACNSLLNGLALQQVPIPPRLLADLSLFCRENTGFTIPFQQLAVECVDTGNPANSLERRVCHVGMQMSNSAALALNQLQQIRDGHLTSATPLLESLGLHELQLERIYAYFGWSQMVVRTAARLAMDKAEQKPLE